MEPDIHALSQKITEDDFLGDTDVNLFQQPATHEEKCDIDGLNETNIKSGNDSRREINFANLAWVDSPVIRIVELVWRTPGLGYMVGTGTIIYQRKIKSS